LLKALLATAVSAYKACSVADMELVTAETWFSVQCPRSCCETDLSAKHIPFAESLGEEFMPARSIRLSEDSIAHIRSHDEGQDVGPIHA
jgi:hypothetical protein